ncbi:MAG: hypothetical protein P4M14_12480 [Gammaproteobacteria bacterium]|nr:hypothetical protein [Gammaproteobacteria bacterium]
MLPTINRNLKATTKFTPLVLIFFLAYFIFQLVYIPYSKFSVDEFWFAHHIYQYTNSLPYRDFPPYKTVLGYYLLTLPFFISHTVITPLYLIKMEIALLNTILFLIMYEWLTRFFQPKAVFSTFILLMANQLFLVYSVDLRVDMLASWFCLISILLMRDQRWYLAGASIAIGFLISQKALWYFAATNCALGVYWLLVSRNLETIKQTLQFNLATLLVITLYIALWSIVSSPHQVLYNVFYEAYLQSKITWFAPHTGLFWQEMLTNGPILYFMWPLTWLSLFIKPKTEVNTYSNIFFFVLTTTVMIFILTYKQSFPYNMVFSVPVLILLYANFFSWLLRVLNDTPFLSNNAKTLLFWFLSLYVIGLVGLIIIFDLPLAYFGIPAIPILLYYLMTRKNRMTTKGNRGKAILTTCLLMTIFVTGVFYPLIRFAMVSTVLNGDYQKSMILTASKLLAPREGYVAGIPLFYDRDQPIPGLRNLIGPAIEYLTTGDKKLEPILLDSLYLTATTPTKIIESFQEHPVKLYVDNIRIVGLPPVLLSFLHSHYMHYWGAIFLYAPVIKSNEKRFVLQFNGIYKIIALIPGTIQIDGQKVSANQLVRLSKGSHETETNIRFRLQLMPDARPILNPEFKADLWDSMTKFIVL